MILTFQEIQKTKQCTDEQFQMAISLATAKLRDVIKRFGDAEGKRRTDEYLNKLIIEELRSVQVSEVTFALYCEKAKKKPATMAVVTGF